MELNYSIVATSQGSFTKFNFDSRPISIRQKDGYWNLSEMAKAGQKRLNSFFRNRSTQDYLAELVKDLNQFEAASNTVFVISIDNASEREFAQRENDEKSKTKPVIEIANIINGAKISWGHPLLALEFARWISPKFAIFSKKLCLSWQLKGTSLSKRSWCYCEEKTNLLNTNAILS